MKHKATRYFLKSLRPFTGISVILLQGIFVLSALFAFPAPASAAVVTWDGEGDDGTCGGAGTGDNWSCGLNWSTNAVPVANVDVATFSSTSDAVDIDSPISPLGVNITSGFTGVITQNATVTIGTSDWIQAGGTFNGNASLFDLNDAFTLSGGTFNAPTGTVTHAGAFTHTTSGVGGTFNHTAGTWVFDGTASVTVNFPTGGETFFNMEINKGSAGATVTLTSNDLVIITGNLNLVNGQINSNSSVTGGFRVDDTFTHGAGFDGGTGQVVFNVPLAFTPTLGGVMPGLYLLNSGSSFTGLGGATTTTFEGTVRTDSGSVFNAGAGTIDFGSGSLLVNAGSTFNHDSGTISFTGSTCGCSIIVDGNANGTITVNNLTVNSGTATTGLTVAGGDTVIAIGAVTLTNGELQNNLGTLEIKGTLSIAAGFDGGTGVLKINVPLALAPATTSVWPGINLFHASSSLTGPAAGTVTFEGPITSGPGIFTVGTGASTTIIQNNLTVNTAGTFLAPNGTIQFTGSAFSIIDVPTTLALNNVTFNKPGTVSITIGDTVQVGGLFTLTDGFCGSTGTAGSGKGIWEQNGTFSYATGWDGGSCQIVFNTAQAISLLSGRPFSGFRFNVAGSSMTLLDNHTIGHDVELAVAGTSFVLGTGSTVLSRSLTVVPGATFTAGATGTLFWANVTNYTHVIDGTLTFNNMDWGDGANNQGFSSAGQGLTFPAGVTTTINGFLKLYVNASNPPPNLDLRSSTPGVQASIDVNGTDNRFGDLDIQDMNNVSSFTIYCIVRCIDSGNNTGFIIGHASALVTAITGNTTESGGTAQFDVVLQSEPSANVTIPVSSTDLSEGTVSTSSLVFTSADWDIPQTITVTGVDDSDDDNNISYGVVLGAATSADSRYAGIDPIDVKVVNEDDELPATSFNVSNSPGFDFEDVKDTASAPITWFEHDYYGHGFLMTASGGSIVDLIPSKIMAGCRINIAGTEYSIIRVFSEVIPGYDGYITVMDDAGTSPEEFDSMLVSGTVNSIVCTDVNDLGQMFHSEFINDQSAFVDVTGYQMVYDPANNGLWNDDGTVINFDLDTLTETSIPRGSGFEPGIGFDPTRGRMWYANHGSDTVTVVNTATATVFATYATCDGPESSVYDPVHDKMWITCGIGDNVWALNADTGAFLHATTFTATPGSFNTRGLVYDSVQDVVWAVIQDGIIAVEIDAATGAFENGTQAASSHWLYLSDTSFANNRSPLFDAPSNQLFFMDAQCDGNDDDYIYRVDATNGDPLGEINVPSCPIDQDIDAVNRVVYVSSDHEGTFTEYRIEDGSVVRRHHGMDPSYGLALDAENDLWLATYSEALLEFVRDGVPQDNYYTMVTNDTGEIDSSTWSSIESMAVAENLDGGNIYYSVSFDDGNTFDVWGSWRPVASRLASVHGGTDGIWYFRDNASLWTPAPSNTAASAISSAVAAGANNQMTGTTLSGLTSADWQSVGGFVGGSTTSMKLATTFYTTDTHNSPIMTSASFVVSNAGISVTPTSGTTTEDGGQAFFDIVLTSAPDSNVTIDLSSSDPSEGTLSDSSVTFTTLNWNIPQTVTVTGVDDALQDGDVSYLVITDPAISGDIDYSGLDADDVSLLNLDNDLPPQFVGTIPDQSWDEDTTLDNAFDLDDYFSDPSGSGLTYSVLFSDTPENITVEIGPFGVVDFSSDLNFYGTDTVTFVAENDYGATSSNQINLTVNSVNDAPEEPVTGFSPCCGDETSDLSPVISWDPATDVDHTQAQLHYVLRIGTDSDPEATFEQELTSADGEAEVQVSGLALNQTYYYVVKTVDPDGAESDWSAVQSFSTSENAPEITVTKKVGINLAAAQPAGFWEMITQITIPGVDAAVTGGQLTRTMQVTILLIQVSTIVLFVTLLYSILHMRRPRNAWKFLVLPPRDSFSSIAETDPTGVYRDSYARYSMRARVSQFLSRISALVLGVSMIVFGLAQTSYSFDDQSGEVVEPGDTLTYEITVANTGAGDATNANLSDTVPEGTVFVEGSTTVNGTPTGEGTSNGTLNFDLNTVQNGDTATVVYQVHIPNPSNYTGSSIEGGAAIFTSNEVGASSNTTSNPFVTSSISGSVLNSETNEGIADVPLELRRQGETVRETVSGRRGGYQFTGLGSGSYVVSATAPRGYEDAEDLRVALDRDENKTDQNIYLTPTGTEEPPVTPPVTPPTDGDGGTDEPIDEVPPTPGTIADAEEEIDDIVDDGVTPDEEEDLAALLYELLNLISVDGIPVVTDEFGEIIPVLITISSPGDLIDLLGRAAPGSDVRVRLCSNQFSQEFMVRTGKDGVWELAVPQDQVTSGKNIVVAESILEGVTSGSKVLGSFVNASEPPNTTLWLIFINLFIILLVSLIVIFLMWWNRRARLAEELRKRKAFYTLSIVVTTIAMVVLAIIIYRNLFLEDPAQEVSFTSKLELPELNIEDVNGVPVQVDETQIFEAEEKIVINGTGTPSSHLSLSVCAGVESYGIDINAQGRWTLELPLDEIPNRNIVYSAAIAKGNKTVVTETEIFAVSVREVLIGLPIWLLILLSLMFIVSAAMFEWSVLLVFASRRKPPEPKQVVPPVTPVDPEQMPEEPVIPTEPVTLPVTPMVPPIETPKEPTKPTPPPNEPPSQA